MESKRIKVLREFVSRLEAILTVDGYGTDAGKVIYLGERPQGSEDDPPYALAVLVGDEDPGWQGEHAVYDLPIDIHALAQLEHRDIEQPWIVVEMLVADIKRAIEQPDRRLGGLALGQGIRRLNVRALPRETGSRFVGAGVTYMVPLAERWGCP